MFQLKTAHDSEFTLSDTQQKYRDKNWQTFLSERAVTENDTLLRYLSHTKETITVAPDVTYKDLVGLRYKKLSRIEPTPFLTVSAIALVETSDGQLLLQERDSGDWPQSLELPGGFVRASMINIDTVEFIKRRVARDFGISEGTLTEITLIDFFSFPEILEKMLVFKIIMNETSTKLNLHNQKIKPIPQGYTVATHPNHFSIPLHHPSRVIIETYCKNLI